jgi:hypothetical protein
MTAESVALVGALAYAHRELIPVLAEHLKDNDGELLPHLVMADVVRWLVEHRDDCADVARALFQWLETAYEGGDDEVRNVIAVSGIEMLPDPGTPGAELRKMLGSHLSSVNPWQA